MKPIGLNEVQIEEIHKLAEEKRRSLGFVGPTPIANDIFTILDRLDIILLEYPIQAEKDRPAFSAAIMYLEDTGNPLTFIGLNTADYFDKQIFALAHELFHYFAKAGTHITRLGDWDNMVEGKANRFAAEFLLPEAVLKSIVIDEFSSSSLYDVQMNSLLRFIARLYCSWWLPYRSLVRRLLEIGAISKEQYEELYLVDERDSSGEFGKTALAINQQVFLMLNERTLRIGTAPGEIELFIRNYEDQLIGDDQFSNLLNLFNKTPGDFGYDIQISMDDENEIKEFFNVITDEDQY